jgi:hypothetical protein
MKQSLSRRPPLWLASSAAAAGIAVVFGVWRWIDHFRADANLEDIRVWIVAARIGLSDGWAHIYDLDLETRFSAQLGASDAPINTHQLFVGTPPTAWMMVPLAPLPIWVSYLIWTLISLAAFAGACWLVAPGGRFARMTLLLASLALWPVDYQFLLGQWVALTIALLAICWWLLERGRYAMAGVLLALAFCVKPQDLFLLPIALLISGRWRTFLTFAGVVAALGICSAAAIGPAGTAAWLHDVRLTSGDPASTVLTYTYLLGPGPAATAIEAVLGLAALGLAWYRRERLDIVFALGLVGTTASATYLHEYDVAILVLPAWILMRSTLSLTQRAWLLVGLAAAQFIAIGLALPMLLWEPAWIALLSLEPDLERLEARRGRFGGGDKVAESFAQIRGG